MEKTLKPRFARSGEETIFHQLRLDVNNLVRQLEPKRKRSIIVKAVLFPVLYGLTYGAILFAGQHTGIFYAAYFLLGVWLVMMFLNTIHDAVHGTIFNRKWLNDAYVYLFDLMGANSYIWRLRHVRFHHNYPNVNGWDTDIEQSSLARIFPTGKALFFHRYQHIYLPLLYPLYLFNWLLIRDFKDFFNKQKTIWKLATIPRFEYVKLFFFKAFFLFYLILLPKLVLGIAWVQAIAGFLLMLFTASILSLMVLLSPHANTESEFPLPGDGNQLPHSWMMHMLLTTNDITHDNWFTRFFMGCFNFHVVHHLFPNVNHVYYPEVTALLRQYADRHQWPYRTYTLGGSLGRHYRLLRQNGVTEDIFEETM
ncbi:fatty acid desaturase [uncultured Chitinophaga sp.]|jgi:Fatty acid desaturase|uniref:fatty acid desaturase family protein n=1 Tax=uncultured Chitinophaga sp. TaxID=339340 RepID=UPI0026112F6D|nr:fatty acid desaturase [uncultured Chitinophaga sp.]